jgi:hypothetical protein
MESPLKSPDPAPASPKLGSRAGLWIAALGIILTAIIIFSALFASSNRKMIWLTPADVAPVNHSGPLTQLKYQIKKLVMPVWKHFQRNPSLIQLNANILTVAQGADGQINLGPTEATGKNGMRGWILSPLQLSTFLQSIKTNIGVVVVNSPDVLTMEGMQARVQAMEMVPGRPDTNNSALNSPSIPVGLMVDMLPKVAADSVKVLVGALSTSFAGRSPGQVPLIRTNLAVACQVVIPNGGALVIDGGKPENPYGTNFWLLICPTILDTQGRPRKP